ncbi:MAG: dihydroorotate dehydrogenase [Actinobacteria bacterium]|nr:dihydroorotate dehydrogenase [Actinomycetota bacterium]
MQSQHSSPDLIVHLGPLTLAHPVINASGTMEILELADVFGEDVLKSPPVGAYVPKTITLKPRQGNLPPRILETPAGMINAIGLSGGGLEAFVGGSLPRLLTLSCPLILSIGGFSPREYVELAAGLRQALQAGAGDGWTQRVGLELNVSCPNVHSGCLLIGADPGEIEGVVSAVRREWPGLLITKLTPNVTDIASIAAAAAGAGADAISAVNTFKGMVIDRRSLRPFLGNVTGGLSGPAIKPLALRAIFEIFARVEVPVIGMGGIRSAEDALDFLACGATVVAVGSAGFTDPWLTGRIASGLATSLSERGLTLRDVVGIAHRREA